MPIATIHVESVETFSGSGFYEIKGRDAADLPWTFSTNKPWISSLADRARLKQRAVEIGWRETRRWGRDVVTIGFLNAPLHDAASTSSGLEFGSPAPCEGETGSNTSESSSGLRTSPFHGGDAGSTPAADTTEPRS